MKSISKSAILVLCLILSYYTLNNALSIKRNVLEKFNSELKNSDKTKMHKACDELQILCGEEKEWNKPKCYDRECESNDEVYNAKICRDIREHKEELENCKKESHSKKCEEFLAQDKRFTAERTLDEICQTEDQEDNWVDCSKKICDELQLEDSWTCQMWAKESQVKENCEQNPDDEKCKDIGENLQAQQVFAETCLTQIWVGDCMHNLCMNDKRVKRSNICKFLNAKFSFKEFSKYHLREMK